MTATRPRRREIPQRRRALDVDRNESTATLVRPMPLLAPLARQVLREARHDVLAHVLRCPVCRRPPRWRRCGEGRHLEDCRRQADRSHGHARRVLWRRGQ